MAQQNKPLNTLIREESLKIYVFDSEKTGKVSVFLSHIKTRHGYDFSLYFTHKFLMSFLQIFYNCIIYKPGNHHQHSTELSQSKLYPCPVAVAPHSWL